MRPVPTRFSVRSSSNTRRATWVASAPLALLFAGCTDNPLPMEAPLDSTASASVSPATLRTGKGDLITGDAAAFAEALKAIGPDGEVLVWLKETGTARPSAEFLANLPGSAAETIALATEAPGAKRRNDLGPASVRGASIDAVVKALTQAGAMNARRMQALPVLVVKLPEQVRVGALHALLRNPNVDYVSAVRSGPVEFLAAPVGTNPIDEKHTVHRIPQAWDLTRGSGARVGILDSGLARSTMTGAIHEDAQNFVALGFVDDECGSSTANYGGCVPYDDHGHGSAMAGVAGANDNGLGYVGVAPFATIYSMKVAWNTYIQGHCRDDYFGNTRFCLESDDFVRAVDYAASRRLHVLSMSFSHNGNSDVYRALSTARNSYGVFLVAATGNTAGAGPVEPASYDVVMGIAGVDAAGNNIFSTAARDVSGFAGGGTMAPTCYQEYYCDAGSPGRYGGTGGTSAATANVAGIVGLIRAYHPNESVAQVMERLVNTAEGPNRVVNAYAALTYQRPLSVSIYGPSTLQPYEYGSWSAGRSGGTGPYSYAWYRDGVLVATGETYSDSAGDYSFQLQLNVTDANGTTATSYMYVSVQYVQEPCGDPNGPPQICP